MLRVRSGLALGLSIALIVACTPSSVTRSAPPTAVAGAMAVNDLTMHPAMDIYPVAYRSMSTGTRAAYDHAVAHQGILKWMPCYCGCAAPGHGRNGHKNNYDCYVAETFADGSVMLDLHATTCYTCVGITNDVAGFIRSGTTDLPTIRRAIDQKWSRYGPSTPTTFPP